MRRFLLFPLCLVLLTPASIFAQSIKHLFEEKNYKEIVKYAAKEDELTGEELYMLGFALFQAGDDKKAISYYDKAIIKSFDKPFVHFFKGLSYRYLEQTNDALQAFDMAIAADSLNQEYACEKAFTYYLAENYDKALDLYEKAKKLPNTYQAPWYMVPHIHFLREKDEVALKGFYDGLPNISPDNPYYLKALMDIGKLQHLFKKDLDKAADAYNKVILADPTYAEAYPKLMKVYNAAGKFQSADTIFAALKKLYDAGMVDETTKKYKNSPIAEYSWNNQLIVVYRYFEAPKKTLDLIYKAYLLDKEGKKVERTFLTEQTFQLGKDSPKHLLCETFKEGHSTFPIGWKDDNIPVEDFVKQIISVLNEKLKPGASSNFGSKGN